MSQLPLYMRNNIRAVNVFCYYLQNDYQRSILFSALSSLKFNAVTNTQKVCQWVCQ